MRNKKIITYAFVLLALALPLFAGALQTSSAAQGELKVKKFATSDKCSLLFGRYFAIRVSGFTRGSYVYINKMQYKLRTDTTGGRSQFRLNIPDANLIPKRYTADINWWGDQRRSDWWSQDNWTTFWKRSYANGKRGIRGADWSGKFRVDRSGSVDVECRFKLEV